MNKHDQFYLFTFQGPGGCGKTYLYNTLIGQIKQDQKGGVVCASTGIAALLLINGMTAHRAFRIPENVYRNTPPKFSYEKADSKKLRDAKVVIIDEISMMHRDVFNFIDRTLQDLQPRDQKKEPFGGKIVVIGGDFKQLLPVVEGIFLLLNYIS